MNNGVQLIDALSNAQFLGQQKDLGLQGHIPGAVNIPGAGLVSPATGCFLPDSELSIQFPIDRSWRYIVYCGSGLSAASVAFVMVRLGFEDVAIYMPGLQEWVTDPTAPLNCA